MKNWLILGMALLLAANAAAVTLEWDANTETNLAGYRVYSGRSSRIYDSVTNLGLQTLITLPTQTGTVYYAVTAYDTDGLESDFSDEVFYTAPRIPSRPPLNLRLVGTNALSTVRLLQSTNLVAWTETGIAFVSVTNGAVFYKVAAPAPAAPLKRLVAPTMKTGKLAPK